MSGPVGATRRTTAERVESVGYCRTLSERQVDWSLRLYNSSRSASRCVWTRLELARVSSKGYLERPIVYSSR